VKKVGFVGVGNMGKLMAENLLKKGFEVIAYDLRREAVEAIAAKGAIPAENIKTVGAMSDIVFSMVLNFQQIKSVAFGEEGLIQNMRPGSCLIITSTISPAQVREVEEYAKAYQVEVVDSPVSGGMAGAQAGTLSMMVACQNSTFEKCEDVLRAVGSNTEKVSENVGVGQTVKAAIQLLVSIHMAAAGEALVMLEKAGVDTRMACEIIAKSAGNSFMFEQKKNMLLARDFERRGALDIQIKDLDICLQLGRELGTPLYLSALTRELFLTAESMGYGKEDLCAVAKVYENAAQVEIKG